MGTLTAWSKEELRSYLARLGRRLRWRDGWDLAQRSLPLAAAGSVAIQLGGRVWPVNDLWLWSLVPLVIWLLVVLAVSMIRPYPASLVARRVDLELGLKERLSTAAGLEIWNDDTIGESESAWLATTAFQADLVARQHRDAVTTARNIEPRRAYPLRWLRRPTLMAGILLMGVLALGLLPNPMDAVLAERAEIAQAAEEQADEIEDLKAEIEEAEGLTPEERERLLRELQELAEQLRANPGDRAGALADISKMEENLRQRLNPHAGLQQAALESLAAQLNALVGKESAQKGDLSEAAKALQDLTKQLDAMEAEQRESLTQQLAQMAARAAQAGQGELAQALASMAQAAQSGDSQAASQAAQQAAGAISQAQAELSDQAALEKALSQLQNSRQVVANAGQEGRAVARGEGQSGQGQGEGQSQGDGQGQGEGQGEGDGQGQGQGQGQGSQAGSGGGTDANTLPPATRTGQAGDPQGPGQSSGQSQFESQVFVPWERRQGLGDEFNIPGQDTGQGETQVREGQDPLLGASGPALVPYREVFYNYFDAANQAIENSYIPSGLKDYVREYFSQLEP